MTLAEATTPDPPLRFGKKHRLRRIFFLIMPILGIIIPFLGILTAKGVGLVNLTIPKC